MCECKKIRKEQETTQIRRLLPSFHKRAAAVGPQPRDLPQLQDTDFKDLHSKRQVGLWVTGFWNGIIYRRVAVVQKLIKISIICEFRCCNKLVFFVLVWVNFFFVRYLY